MSRHVKMRYFLSKIVEICAMSQKMAASAMRANSTLCPTLLGIRLGTSYVAGFNETEITKQMPAASVSGSAFFVLGISIFNWPTFQLLGLAKISGLDLCCWELATRRNLWKLFYCTTIEETYISRHQQYEVTLPKAQRTRWLSSSCQSSFLKSYQKFKHKSWSHFIFRIST